MHRRLRRWLWLGGALAALPAPAVILAGGDGAGNTNAPPDDPGWANVGRILMDGRGPSSVTYLGNDWFLTAYHVWNLDNPTGVLVNAGAYAVDPASWVRLTNSTGPAAGTAADLALFRVTTAVTGLPTLALSASPLATGSAVTLIGDGYDRQPGLTCWDSTWQVTNSTDGVYSGYYWAATAGTRRWGLNSTDASGWIDDGFGTSRYFQTTFTAGGSNTAQAATYDSGGGVFFQEGGTWELAGIMIAAEGPTGQPAGTAVFGDQTYMADVAAYHDQVVAITAIPEPAGVLMGGAGALLALRQLRRWSR